MENTAENPENDESAVRALFDFKTMMLLLPEHTEPDTPEEDFLAYGTSDDDMQF